MKDKKVRLLFTGKDKLEFRLTKNPLTRPWESPKPTGKALSDAKNDLEREQILKHPSYSESEVVTLKPGINEFKNEEWAEYLYAQLGQPDTGGSVDIGGGRFIDVENKNVLIEVDEKGDEITNHFWPKYRRPVSLGYKKDE